MSQGPCSTDSTQETCPNVDGAGCAAPTRQRDLDHTDHTDQTVAKDLDLEVTIGDLSDVLIFVCMYLCSPARKRGALKEKDIASSRNSLLYICVEASRCPLELDASNESLDEVVWCSCVLALFALTGTL